MNVIQMVLPFLISSGVLAAVCKWMTVTIKKSIKTSKAHEKALENGLQAMLRDRILQLARYCFANGYAGIKERENFESMYTSYKELGGNGVISDIAEQFHELPLTMPKGEV